MSDTERSFYEVQLKKARQLTAILADNALTAAQKESMPILTLVAPVALT